MILVVGMVACGLWAVLLIRSLRLGRHGPILVMPTAALLASSTATLTAVELSDVTHLDHEFVVLVSTMGLGALLLGGVIAVFALWRLPADRDR